MPPTLTIRSLIKTYTSGFQALKRVDLDIRRGEIFARLGSNGAGKTTLISIVGGIVTASGGTVAVDGQHRPGLSPPPAWTWSCATTCGRWCGAYARTGSPSS